MKRFITSLVTIFYLCFSTGATLHLHYCMGKFVNLSFTNTNAGECLNCGMQSHGTDNGCCKDVEVSVKISDAHLHATTAESLPAQQVDLPPVAIVETPIFIPYPPSPITKQFYASGHPPLAHSALFIEQRNIRI